MTGIALLTSWSATGAVLASRTSRPEGSGGSWIPIAMFLGPLWAAVKQDIEALD